MCDRLYWIYTVQNRAGSGELCNECLGSMEAS